MLFRQLFDSDSSTYTYLLACEKTRKAVLIDPVYEKHERDASLINELELELLYVLDTHVHADHVTGAWLLKHEFGAQIALSQQGGAENVDVLLADKQVLAFGEEEIEARATPGHTDGCTTFVCHAHKLAFTGDALLVRGAGRTDFQQGSAATLFKSIQDQIFSLAEDFLLYPAHDYAGRTCTSVDEEKRLNPRVGGDASEQDFVGYMDNLGLAHPKKLAIALPANLRSGRPESEDDMPSAPSWGPLHRTYAGIWEVEPHWVAENADALTILDVRGEDEFTGELGHAKGAVLIPLGELADRVQEIPRDRPVVTLCRSGRRSARATQILEKNEFREVANFAGGMIRWRALELPVDA